MLHGLLRKTLYGLAVSGLVACGGGAPASRQAGLPPHSASPPVVAPIAADLFADWTFPEIPDFWVEIQYPQDLFRWDANEVFDTARAFMHLKTHPLNPFKMVVLGEDPQRAQWGHGLRNELDLELHSYFNIEEGLDFTLWSSDRTAQDYEGQFLSAHSIVDLSKNKIPYRYPSWGIALIHKNARVTTPMHEILHGFHYRQTWGKMRDGLSLIESAMYRAFDLIKRYKNLKQTARDEEFTYDERVRILSATTFAELAITGLNHHIAVSNRIEEFIAHLETYELCRKQGYAERTCDSDKSAARAYALQASQLSRMAAERFRTHHDDFVRAMKEEPNLPASDIERHSALARQLEQSARADAVRANEALRRAAR